MYTHFDTIGQLNEEAIIRGKKKQALLGRLRDLQKKLADPTNLLVKNEREVMATELNEVISELGRLG